MRDPVTRPMLVMNGDVLTRLAFGDLVDFHVEHATRATQCVGEHPFQAPHGVAEVDGVRLTAPRQKPVFRRLANAGVYRLNGSVLSRAPARGPYDMPELLASPAADGERVGACPIHEYWLNIRRPRDFESARTDFGAVFAPG